MSSISRTFDQAATVAIDAVQKQQQKAPAWESKESLAAKILDLKISSQQGLIDDLRSYESMIQGQLSLVKGDGVDFTVNSSKADWEFSTFTSFKSTNNSETVLDNLGKQSFFDAKAGEDSKAETLDFKGVKRKGGQEGFQEFVDLKAVPSRYGRGADPKAHNEAVAHNAKYHDNQSVAEFLYQYAQDNTDKLKELGVTMPHDNKTLKGTEWQKSMKDWFEKDLQPALEGKQVHSSTKENITNAKNPDSARSVLDAELSLVRSQIKAAKSELANLKSMSYEELIAEGGEFENKDVDQMFTDLKETEQTHHTDSERRTNALSRLNDDIQDAATDYAPGKKFGSAMGKISGAAYDAIYEESASQTKFVSNEVERLEGDNSVLLADLNQAQISFMEAIGNLSTSLSEQATTNSDLESKLAELADKKAFMETQKAIIDDPSKSSEEKQQAKYLLGQTASEISTIASDIAGLQGLQSDANSEISSLNSQISNFSINIGDLSSKIYANTALITEYNSSLAEL